MSSSTYIQTSKHPFLISFKKSWKNNASSGSTTPHCPVTQCPPPEHIVLNASNSASPLPPGVRDLAFFLTSFLSPPTMHHWYMCNIFPSRIVCGQTSQPNARSCNSASRILTHPSSTAFRSLFRPRRFFFSISNSQRTARLHVLLICG